MRIFEVDGGVALRRRAVEKVGGPNCLLQEDARKPSYAQPGPQRPPTAAMIAALNLYAEFSHPETVRQKDCRVRDSGDDDGSPRKRRSHRITRLASGGAGVTLKLLRAGSV